MVQNGFGMVRNVSEWFGMAQNGSEWFKINTTDLMINTHQTSLVLNGLEWLRMVHTASK